jgi:hypothetical protein
MVAEWLKRNWFLLLQGVGIIGGLMFATLASRRDVKTRRAGELLTLAQAHRELWGELHRRPELSRIRQPQMDLVGNPLTVAEEEFLNVVIVHFFTGWHLARCGSLVTLDVLATDIQTFFCLPLPHAVWESTKSFRDPAFVRFVDECLGKHADNGTG